MTGTSHTSTSEDAATDSLDAAQLLLGVAPASAPGWPNCGEFSIISREDGDSSVSVDYSKNCSASGNIKGQLPWEYSLLQLRKATSCKFEFSIEQMTTDAGAEEMCPTNQGLRLPTTSGLDALAILASNAVSMKTDIPSIHDLKTNDRNLSTCDERTDDSVGQRRGRSVSNPEGMDKWSTLLSRAASSRLHYIQPTIAEESTSDVMAPCTSAMNEGDPARSKRVNFIEEDDHRNCDTEVEEEVEEVNCLTLEQIKAASFADLDIILRRARGKLLEDWVTGNATTNVQCLPHTLAKYQNVSLRCSHSGIV